MAESSLSIALEELQTEVALFIDGTTYAASPDSTKIDRIIEAGQRMFYYPPVVNINGVDVKHMWSWLQPTTTITTSAPITTGTLTYDHTGGASERLITFSTDIGGDLADATATDWEITIAGTTYPLSTATIAGSPDIANLSAGSNPGADVAAGTTYSLARSKQVLPDAFGGLCGNLTYDSESVQRKYIRNVGEGAIRQMKERQVVTTSFPEYCGIRPTLSDAAATGQRFEIVWYPTPDAAYQLGYRFNTLPNTMAASEFPLTMLPYMDLMRLATMARAEQTLDSAGTIRRFYELFMHELKGAVMRDMMDDEPEYFGYNGDNSDEVHRPMSKNDIRVNDVTYDGTLYTG